MAERKKIESASENTVSTIQNAKPVGNATGYRIGAIILWVLALVCEVVAIFTLFGKITISFMNTLTFLIILIVLDLVFLVIGSQLWKKANHINPASKKNPTKFWLWNNMGLKHRLQSHFRRGKGSSGGSPGRHGGVLDPLRQGISYPCAG